MSGYLPTHRAPYYTIVEKITADPGYIPRHRSATSPAHDGFPRVQGACPACGGRSLFLGAGGYVTCSRIDCTNPTASGDVLEMLGSET